MLGILVKICLEFISIYDIPILNILVFNVRYFSRNFKMNTGGISGRGVLDLGVGRTVSAGADGQMGQHWPAGM
jgi:hypothetical protein